MRWAAVQTHRWSKKFHRRHLDKDFVIILFGYCYMSCEVAFPTGQNRQRFRRTLAALVDPKIEFADGGP